jgi:hypothetical protein
LQRNRGACGGGGSPASRLRFSADVENANLRAAAVALLLGGLLGCAWTARRTASDGNPPTPVVADVKTARPIAPLAVPPRANYGRPYVESQMHPLTVACGLAAFSLFGLAAFEKRGRDSFSGD